MLPGGSRSLAQVPVVFVVVPGRTTRTESVERGAEMVSAVYLERNSSKQLSATCHIIADWSLVVLCNIMRRIAACRSYGKRIDCGTWGILEMNAHVAAGGAMCCVAVQHVACAAFAGHCVLQEMWLLQSSLACVWSRASQEWSVARRVPRARDAGRRIVCVVSGGVRSRDKESVCLHGDAKKRGF